MFDIGYSELLLVAVVILIAVGPRELPRLMKHMARWMRHARHLKDQFRGGMDAMIRQSELEDIDRELHEHNARIMAAHPQADHMQDSPPAPPLDPETDIDPAHGQGDPDTPPLQARKGAPHIPHPHIPSSQGETAQNPVRNPNPVEEAPDEGATQRPQPASDKAPPATPETPDTPS